MKLPFSDEELHKNKMHPDYEYETTVSGRKCGDSYKPEGEGWEPNYCVSNHQYKNGIVIKEYWRNWDRLDYTDEEYWKRKKGSLA